MTTDDDLQVIGGGLMRTGTMSLHLALERLLDVKCYHMREVFQNPRHIQFWIDATKKDPSDEEWRAFFKNYGAAVDVPPVAFYKRLLEVYPNAKVILTVRDPRSWSKSVKDTILRERINTLAFPWNIITWLSPYRKFTEMTQLVFARNLGPIELDDEEKMVAAFNRHVEEVKRTVPSDRLLVFESKEGWEPLCRFLDVPVPKDSYPNVNSTDSFQRRVATMRRVQLGIVSGAVLVVSVIAYFVQRFVVSRG